MKELYLYTWYILFVTEPEEEEEEEEEDKESNATKEKAEPESGTTLQSSHAANDTSNSTGK